MTVWDVIYPPNGFRCRCRVQALSARQVRERGIRVVGGTRPKPSQVSVSTPIEHEIVNRKTGEVVTRPGTRVSWREGKKTKRFTPDPGWSYNPGRVGYTSDPLTKPPPTPPDTGGLERRFDMAWAQRARRKRRRNDIQRDLATGGGRYTPADLARANTRFAAADAVAWRLQQRYTAQWKQAASLPPDVDGTSRAAGAALTRARAALTRANISDYERERLMREAIERPDPGAGTLAHIRLSAHQNHVRQFGRLVSPDLLRSQPTITQGPAPKTGVLGSAERITSREALVRLTPGEPGSITAHELGHTIEYGSDDLLRESVGFLARANRRVVGARRGKVHGQTYATGMGRWDDAAKSEERFLDRYAGLLIRRPGAVRALPSPLGGKGSVTGTEIVSVGLERLYHDPVDFARRDWEFFSFIVRRVVWR